jgi:tryptophan-rich sensory protein
MTPEQIFGIVFAVIFVFILIREVICWYFKINARLDISKQILAELKKNNEDKDQS